MTIPSFATADSIAIPCLKRETWGTRIGDILQIWAIRPPNVARVEPISFPTQATRPEWAEVLAIPPFANSAKSGAPRSVGEQHFKKEKGWGSQAISCASRHVRAQWAGDVGRRGRMVRREGRRGAEFAVGATECCKL